MSATFKLHLGDCITTMRTLPEASIDAIVTDPPYELGFMGKAWDASGIANSVDMWREALRVLKPGGHLLAFSGSRTYHRMVCAIEDAGFEIRDQIMWIYGSGFPKSLDVSKAIDKAAGAERESTGETVRGGCRAARGGTELVGSESIEAAKWKEITVPATDAARQWQGWGTALKPAHEPIVVARKPLSSTVAANVLAHGTGAINVDGCRVPGVVTTNPQSRGVGNISTSGHVGQVETGLDRVSDVGRWPANLIHDGSAEVVALFPESSSGAMKSGTQRAAQEGPGSVCYGTYGGNTTSRNIEASSGSAARFFYAAKASKADRGADNVHPTVKPTDLMAYLVRLVTPPGGTVLDPFTGSGSTGKACMREGFGFIGCELSPEYLAIARARIEHEQLLAAQRAYEALLKVA